MTAPTKQRVQLAPARTANTPVGLMAYGRHAAADVTVLDTKPGEVGWLDKAKAYYKAAIAAVGLLAADLSLITLPAPADKWVATAVGVLTLAGTILKANETWVDGL